MYTMTLVVLAYCLRYDTIEEFNVDSNAECDQLNLAHVARKIYMFRVLIQFDFNGEVQCPTNPEWEKSVHSQCSIDCRCVWCSPTLQSPGVVASEVQRIEMQFQSLKFVSCLQKHFHFSDSVPQILCDGSTPGFHGGFPSSSPHGLPFTVTSSIRRHSPALHSACPLSTALLTFISLDRPASMLVSDALCDRDITVSFCVSVVCLSLQCSAAGPSRSRLSLYHQSTATSSSAVDVIGQWWSLRWVYSAASSSWWRLRLMSSVSKRSFTICLPSRTEIPSKQVGTLPGGRWDVQLSRIITDYHKIEAFSLVKCIRRYV